MTIDPNEREENEQDSGDLSGEIDQIEEAGHVWEQKSDDFPDRQEDPDPDPPED